YRYYNRGALPPSRPVQQWFGEFIHGLLEEAYRVWRGPRYPFPWPADQIDELEERIVRRLAARGLRYRNSALLRISKERRALAINRLGPHLFPLVAQAELPLKGVRPLNAVRAEFYEVRGVVDVLTSVELISASPDNRIIQALQENDEVRAVLEEGRRDPDY